MKITAEIAAMMDRERASAVVERIAAQVDPSVAEDIAAALGTLYAGPALEQIAAEKAELDEREARLRAGTVRRPPEDDPLGEPGGVRER